jgi:hypothetical protein
MPPSETNEAEQTGLSCWLCEPYGPPRESSEVRRIESFYKVECLTVCGQTICAAVSVVAAGEPS